MKWNVRMTCVLACPRTACGKPRRHRTAETKVDCNFKISRRRHKEFKLAATKLEISMVELFMRSVDEFLERHKLELLH